MTAAALVAALGVHGGRRLGRARPTRGWPRSRTSRSRSGSDVDTRRGVARLAPYDLVIVDGELTTPARVAAAARHGRRRPRLPQRRHDRAFRSWYRLLKPFRLPDRFEEFDEDYARVSAKGFRRAIAGRIAPKLLAKGFDGLFLDNVDMVEGHPKERRGMRKLVRRLSRAGARAGRVALRAERRALDRAAAAVLDGWNREDVTWTYSFKSGATSARTAAAGRRRPGGPDADRRRRACW